MSIRAILVVVVVLLGATGAYGERIVVNNAIDDLAVTVEESNDLRTVIRLDIGAYSRQPVTIDSRDYYTVSLGREHILLVEGEPALPRVCRSIIVPDEAKMKINILAATYIDLANTPVAPSKGNLPRTVNPEDVPYTFGPVYDADGWYPGRLATLREPFILRDYRGVVVDLNAFQYNPRTQTLRVYTSVTIEVVSDGPGEVNVLTDSRRSQSRIPDFDVIYGRRFINYGFQRDKYTPVEEHGDMLIITYDDFHTAMDPFVAWKQQKGIKTSMVDISSIGNNATAIAGFIKQFYDADSTNLAFVLLVGDHAQITRPLGTGNSDPVYAKVAGSDNYPDIFIGRFSAETVAQVETQVQRTIAYESNPTAGDWFHKGTGIASDDPGTGQGGEHDWEHMNLIRDDLLAFTYTQIDQFYGNNGATAADVSAAVNQGRSIINYCGHGSATSWSTTGFSVTNVNALVNDNLPPFIFSVACNNGEFDIYTCFCEAWLRASHNGVPTGGIGMYGSLISQSWSPPMDAQDEAVDLLCALQNITFGGLCFNGACKMIDLNGADGVEEYNAWTIFGDPSVMVWTDTPAPMTVNHADILPYGATELSIQVVGVEGALCALYAGGTLFGSVYSDASGNAVIPIGADLPIGEDVTLTVTAFNRAPYITPIAAVAPTGPYVIRDQNVIDDVTGGNGNGDIDYGESIVLGMQLKNVGPDTAVDIQAVLTTDDPYVVITDDTENYGDIPGNGATVLVADAFGFEVSAEVPDRHSIDFTVTMTEGARDSVWTSNFSLMAHAPLLSYVSVVVNDASGNSNGIFDPGETVSLTVTLQNTGSGQADEVTAVLAESDVYVSVDDADGTFGLLAGSGGTGDNGSDLFVATADASCPRGHVVTFQMQVSAVHGLSVTVPFEMIVGDRVVFFADDFSFDQGWSGLGGSGEWTIGTATGGAGSDSYGNPDPSEDHSPTSDNQVLGTDLTAGTGGDYNASLGSTYWVTSPLIDCSDFSGVVVSFYRWLGVESATYDHVYVEASDGTNWVSLFENGSTTIDESSWSEHIYDVSSIADSNPDFRLRFGIGPTDGGWNFCGWNLDDLTVKGYGERQSGQIAFDVEYLCDSLIPGDAVAETFWIYNKSLEGTLRVRFSSAEPWLSCNGEQQYIEPGDSLEFEVLVTTAGMVPGDYVGNLTYASNDYLHPYDTMAVLLHLYAPDIDVSASLLEVTLEVGDTVTREVIVSNIGPGRLDYEVSCQMYGGFPRKSAVPVPAERLSLGRRPGDGDKSSMEESYYAPETRGMGGPDGFGYLWVDSDEPGGPDFEWVDISVVGTAVTLEDDSAVGPLSLGFDFPFYENSYSEVYIGSNGIMTFGTGSKARLNTPLPTATEPNDLIALWWDDLDPQEGGAVYYYADNANNRFIVSFVEVRNYLDPSGTGSLTFQALLWPNGRIALQYLSMDPGEDASGLSGSTIGLENDVGTDGLEVVYNAEYVHDSLALVLQAMRWMSVTPAGGTLEPYTSDTLTVTVDASELAPGTYMGEIMVTSNDLETPEWSIPVLVTVERFLCGDANADELVNVGDAIYIINYVFKNGPAPEPLAAGNANDDSDVNIADAVYIINYVFKYGPPPSCP